MVAAEAEFYSAALAHPASQDKNKSQVFHALPKANDDQGPAHAKVGPRVDSQ